MPLPATLGHLQEGAELFFGDPGGQNLTRRVTVDQLVPPRATAPRPTVPGRATAGGGLAHWPVFGPMTVLPMPLLTGCGVVAGAGQCPDNAVTGDQPGPDVPVTLTAAVITLPAPSDVRSPSVTAEPSAE